MHSLIVFTYIDDGTGEGILAPEIQLDYQVNKFSDRLQKNDITEGSLGIGEFEFGNGILKQIEVDPKYGIGVILTTHDTEGKTPSDAKFSALRTYLMSKGMSEVDVNEAIGIESNQRTEFAIANSLIAWLQTH